MHFSTILLGAGLAQFGLATYNLKDDYSGNNFANMFSFDTEDDPTHGYVNFVDQNTAQSEGLFSVSNGVVTMGVDHTNVASGRGRNSIRITSKAQYTHGLVVLDLAHMPGSICGTWPAFWMTGPNWPSSGEIDIIEGVNTGSQNQMTMHTSDGCSLAGSDCEGNTGCPVIGGGSSSYGSGLNSANGGMYAMEWTSSQISIWFFSHGSEPGDINSANPNPSNWGTPTGSFAGGSGCDIDSHFMNNNIIFDTTFCGDWAGNVWSSDGTCSALASTCQDYVQNNPNAFQDAYWAINSLKVYTQDGATTQFDSVASSTVMSSVSIAVPTSSPAAISSAVSSEISSSVASSSTTPSSASIVKSTPSAAPFPSGNATIIAQPTASAAPFPSANSSTSTNTTHVRPSQGLASESSPTGVANVTIGEPGTINNPGPANPSIVSPAEASVVAATQTSTEAGQPSIHGGFHHRHPPGFGPKSKRVSRVARHLQEHARNAHGHS